MSGVLVLVAVRLKSTRLRRKALADLAGEPLILRLHQRVRRARLPSEIVWCTSRHPDDMPLEALARQHGVAVHRGDELDVMSRFLAVARERGAETVVRVTGDNPLTDPDMMDLMIHAHHETGAEYTYTEDLPRGTRAEVISAAALQRCHALLEDRNASEYMTLMLKRPDRFRVLKVDAPVAALKRPDVRLTVDTPADLEVIRGIYEAFAGSPPELLDVLRWLDAHPELVGLNRDVQPTAVDDGINVRLRGD